MQRIVRLPPHSCRLPLYSQKEDYCAASISIVPNQGQSDSCSFLMSFDTKNQNLLRENG